MQLGGAQEEAKLPIEEALAWLRRELWQPVKLAQNESDMGSQSSSRTTSGDDYDSGGQCKMPQNPEEAQKIQDTFQLEMQRQDQQLLEKLLKLHTALRELKVECADWEGSDPSRDGFFARARSSSEDTGAPLLPRGSLNCGASRRNSLP